MKYYEMHEEVCKDLCRDGFISWDRNKKVDELYQHEINRTLGKGISSYFSTFQNKKITRPWNGNGDSCSFFGKKRL